MTMPIAQARGERYMSFHEKEAALYVDSIREALHQNAAALNSNLSPSSEVNGQIETEIEVSRTFAERVCSEQPDDQRAPEEIGWISESFSGLMARIVRISARASETDSNMMPFAKMDAAGQDLIRQRLLDEHLKLSGILAAPGRRPARTTYELSPLLYYSPEDAERFIWENEDLGRVRVIRLLTHCPLNAATLVEQARDTFEAAAERFPAIPHSEILRAVLSSPKGYEEALRRYAKKKGLRLEVTDEEPPETDEFLRQVRQLMRTGEYERSRLHLPAETVEAARELGKEAVAFMDETEGREASVSNDSQDERFKAGFQAKVEHLALAANEGWRKGRLPISPERAPEDFRRSLYARFLGDFSMMHVELGSELSGKAMKRHPVLYYEPGEVRKLAAANSDLPTMNLRRLLLKDPNRTPGVIQEFRERVAAVMQANPKLLLSEAMTTILDSPNQEIPVEAGETSGELEPIRLIEQVRAFLDTDTLLGNIAREVRAEIEERRPEAREHFENLGWNFAGIRLKKQAKDTLLKQIEEFIISSERAYREGEAAARIRDYTPEQRTAIYELIGENFARIGELIELKTAKDWRCNPALSIGADRLSELRERYDWLSTASFRRVVITNIRDVAGGLERAENIRNSLKAEYPGITDALANRLAVVAPLRASGLAMEHLVKITEREYRRRNSRLVDPNPENPKGILRNLKTLFRNQENPQTGLFDDETEARMRGFRNGTTAWIAEQDGSEHIDSPNLKKLLDSLECYTRTSHALWIETDGDYPSILELPDVLQRRFMKKFYDNQLALNGLVKQVGNGSLPEFQAYKFGFYHDAAYLEKLWEQYGDYLPRRIITYTALDSPRKPIDKLNNLVEHRAHLIRQYPDLKPDEINEILNIVATSK